MFIWPILTARGATILPALSCNEVSSGSTTVGVASWRILPKTSLRRWFILLQVTTKLSGNYQIIEGTREAAAFHLQIILNIVERMPRGGRYDALRSSIGSLLKLSEAVLQKAQVREYTLGEEIPQSSLPASVLDLLPFARDCVRFTESELNELGITSTSLADFACDIEEARRFRDDAIFHTGLERRPVAFRGSSAYLLLPTAVGSAITRFVMEQLWASGQLGTFERALADEYRRLFQDSPLLGEGPGAPIHFQEMECGRTASALVEVDAGRFLQFIFFVENLDGFLDSGFNSMNADIASLPNATQYYLHSADQEASKQPGFKQGITLLVGCGIGRTMALDYREEISERWELELISGHDFYTLCWVQDFDSLSLFRLLDSCQALACEGVTLLNPNGLLNLVAWSRQLDGHLVSHSRLPVEFANRDRDNLVVIDQSALRSLRREVLKNWQPRRALDSDGHWVPVMKAGPSLFEEDNAAPLFISHRDLATGRLRSVYVTETRPYWIELSACEGAPKGSVFEHWMMLNTWLRRAAPVIDLEMPSLPKRAVSFHVHFDEIVDDMQEMNAVQKGLPELRALLRVSVLETSASVQIDVGEGFDDGLQQAENVAERELVEALVAGAAALSTEPIDEQQRNQIVGMVCPNSDARYMHRFEARSYREFVRAEIGRQPLLIDDMDAAAYKMGLAWRVHPRESGADIRGAEQCKAFLNSLVTVVLDSVCGELKQLDRRELIEAVLRNHEAARCDRDRWRRTARANIAIHTDRRLAIDTIVRHEGRLNACSIASCVLLEAAICECPISGGRRPGKLDISRLMAQIMLVHHWGGYSDAIHWGAADAHLLITPLGDVHFDHTFFDSVYEPFGRIGGERQVLDAAARYAERYEPADEAPDVQAVLEPEFLAAWEAEFGVSVEDLRLILELLERACLEDKKAVAAMRRSRITGMIANAIQITEAAASEILRHFILSPRAAWRSTGDGVVGRDWYPWRFRRRLSVLRRPFLQMGEGEDSDVVFAPGLLHESFGLTLGTLHRGEIPDAQMNSSQMRSWLGSRNHRHRLSFNSAVASRMQELGWKTRHEMKLTAIIGGSLDRDYGDVDVVAWRADSRRVLMIECKDLQYHKTIGEVAEQLHDFRGEVGANGRPDLMKKHLDRVEILKKHHAAIAKTLHLTEPIQVEAHIVFKNPVPMQFVSERLASKIKLSLFNELGNL